MTGWKQCGADTADEAIDWRAHIEQMSAPDRDWPTVTNQMGAQGDTLRADGEADLRM